MQMDIEELKKGGVVKLKQKDMFSVWVRAVCNNMDARKLRKIADLAEKYGKGYVLFSTRQFPIIPHVVFNDVGTLKEELGKVELTLDRCGKRIRNTDVCYDANLCPYAVLDPISLGEKIDRFWREDPGGFKIKISIAGCERQCTSPRALADVGFVGARRSVTRGYDVYLGGKLGLNPFVGIKMADLLTEGECVRFLGNYIDLLRREGKENERGADLIARLGEGAVRRAVARDLKEGFVPDLVRCDTKQTGKIGGAILRIRATNGEVSCPQVRKIADVAEEYGLGFVHFPVRGGPEIPGIEEGEIAKIREELKKEGLSLLGRGVDNLQTCFGGYCSNGNFDCQALLLNVEKIAEKVGLNKLNVTISASGCPNSCGISHLSDIGFIGTVRPAIEMEKCNGCGICARACLAKSIEVVDGKAVIHDRGCRNCGMCVKACPFEAIYEKGRGISILVGGRGPHFMDDGQNGETRLADKIVDLASEEEALRITEKILKLLKEREKSAADLVEELGPEKFKTLIMPARKILTEWRNSAPEDDQVSYG